MRGVFSVSPMILQIVPNTGFRKEIEANAARGNTTPERWLSVAIEHFATVLRWMKDTDGYLVAGKGDELMRLEEDPLSDYRANSNIRVYSGMTLADFGGRPVNTKVWYVPVSPEIAEKLQRLTSADSPEEAVGYAIYRQSRFYNSLREDYPEWEPGIVSADGVFRSLAVRGFRRLRGSTYDPVVPPDLGIPDRIKAWVALAAGREPIPVDLDATARRDPILSAGVLYCPLGDDPPANGHRAPATVLNERPIIELILTGSSPTAPICFDVTAHSRPTLGEESPPPYRVHMADLLGDPVPLAEIQAFLKGTPAKALIVSATLAGCPHMAAAFHPCKECPGWPARARR